MEQYWMPKRLDFENLRYCLNNYSSTGIYIRDKGGIREDGKFSCQGRDEVNELLEDKKLDFKKNKKGLSFFIDDIEVFHFSLEQYEKGFGLEYERILEDGGLVMLREGINPYDKNLPEPKTSILRNVIDRHLIEISFKGRIDIEFHSWWKKPYWKYWNVKKN